jgi:cation:H+ antiporter
MKRELPLMIAISAALYIMAIDKKIGLIDGVILFTGIIIFVSYQVYNTISSKRKSGNSTDNADGKTCITESTDKQSPAGRKYLLHNVLYILIGLTCLLIGSHILVKSAIFIAGRLGVSEMLIGLTVVAFGTSVPEMATSVVSILRKEADICVGNVIGSNIFNILMVIGSVALVKPLNVARETLFFEFPVMLLFSVALIPMIRGSLRVNRLEGCLLTAGYFVFIFLLFYR